MSAAPYALEQAELDIATLIGNVDRLSEILSQNDFTAGTTPNTPSGGYTQFSATGQQKYASSDGNAYNTGRLTVVLINDFTVNSTSPLTVLSAPVAAGTYEIEFWAVVSNTTAPDSANWAFTGPAAATKPQLMDFESKTTGTATVGYGASSAYTTGFSNQGVAGNQQVLMRATVQFTASGTLAVTGKENVNGNTITVFGGARLRLCPVT